jgi:hypothetical protein
VYQEKHFSRDSSSVEDEDADGASDEIEIEVHKIDNYGDEFVDTCGFSVTTDKPKFTVDHIFTLFAEYSDVVGWCFMEVCFPECTLSVQTCEAGE